MDALITKWSQQASAAATPTELAPRWAAVVARDSTTDGTFYYSVRTTGVYCRPSCAARLANPKNVRFHVLPADAERAGFRPCKRCKPDQPPMEQLHAAKVAETCRRIEEADEAPSLAELAQAVDLSPHHFHRVFKAVAGVTLKEYAAAHRAERVRDGLKRSNTVTEAIYDAGFNSSGRFYAQSDAVLGMTPRDYRAGGANTQIQFAVGECSIGAILVARSAKGVCAILLDDDPNALVHDLQDRFPQAELIGGDAGFEALVARVVGFVEAPGLGLDLPARRAGHGLPAAGLAGVARNSGWGDRELRRGGPTHWRAKGGASSGGGVRGQRARRSHPVPPCGQDRRRAVGLSVGRRTQTCPAGERAREGPGGAGGAGVSAALDLPATSF